MRIISGKYKGRRLQAPKNLPVRPTTDFAKESLFNILNHQFPLAEVQALDLFSGTGNISYELISRGAASVLAVDQHFGCVRFIKQTAQQLGTDQIKAIKADVFRFIQTHKGSYDLIYADPPYHLDRLEELPDLILKNKMLKEGAWFILEHGPEHQFEDHSNCLFSKNYGNVNFAVFTQAEEA